MSAAQRCLALWRVEGAIGIPGEATLLPRVDGGVVIDRPFASEFSPLIVLEGLHNLLLRGHHKGPYNEQGQSEVGGDRKALFGVTVLHHRLSDGLAL